jgi:hypothetical protein
MNRRVFVKTMGLAGAASCLAGRATDAAVETAADTAAKPKVATRPFGKTGRDVSMLSLGGMFDIPNNQRILRQAYEYGVTYWDTADCYGGGKSETGMGLFFEKFPERRKDIFLVTKSDKRDPAGMTELLARSLERMKTDYIDLYFIHGVKSLKEMTGETRAWAEKAKKEGKIKLFGFSTHANMEDCLIGAPELGFIDGIMVKYNFHLMESDRMKKGVEACVKAGIGLTAMKVQAGGPIKMDSETAVELADSLLKTGYTEGQAKLKVVWDAPGISAICSQMPDLKLLMMNIAAALNRTSLSRHERDLFRRYAEETRGSFCAGCDRICSARSGGLPVCDVMRQLMYHDAYGELGWAREQFLGLPADARARLAGADYRAAEAACPQGLPIGRLMREAAARWTA